MSFSDRVVSDVWPSSLLLSWTLTFSSSSPEPLAEFLGERNSKGPPLCYFPRGYDRECSKNELRMFILFGEGITPLSRRDKSKNTPTTIKIFQSILWFVQMKWEIIATFNQPAYIIIALLKLVYWLLRAVSLVSNVAHGPLVFSLIIFTLITRTRSEYFIN